MNVLNSLLNITECRNFNLDKTKEVVNNMVSSQGKPLEKFVRASFCGIPDSGEKIYESDVVFCYQGSTNNPPDAMLKDGKDAIEIKKVEKNNGTIHLNSSLPKQTLNLNDHTITNDAKTCEKWQERDMLYVIGHVEGDKIRSLFFVYGDCMFKKTKFYKDRFEEVKDSLGKIDGLDQSGNEYGTVKNADRLDINTNMRLRPLNSFDNPLRIFSKVIPYDDSEDFSLFAIMRNTKFDNFEPESKSRIESSSINVTNTTIPDPDERGRNVDIKVFSFTS